MASAQAVRVLLVESDRAQALRLTRMLRAGGGRKFRVRRAHTACQAQRFLEDGGAADVALFSLCLPDAESLEVLSEAQRAAPNLPIVVIGDRPDEALACSALRLGAQDFLVKSQLCERHLARALFHAIVRQEVQASLRDLFLHDELSGLYNRRGFITLAESRQILAERQGAQSRLVFCDVDDLKHINDTFGHREGDCALKELAQVFQECFRESDIVARIGGDEFCAFLTDAGESSEAVIRVRLHAALEARNARANRPYRISASVGIVEISGPHGIEHHMARADAQMYAHKRNKRSHKDDTHRVHASTS